MMIINTIWTSSGKTFKVGDRVISKTGKFSGFITSIKVCGVGDGHVIVDGDENSLTDFHFVELDKAYYRDKKLNDLGI